MKNLKYIFVIFAILFLGYFIYLKIPFTNAIIESPYKNAFIKEVYLRKRSFLENSMGSIPISSEYQFFYNGNKIYTQAMEYDDDIYRFTIIKTIWYKDSVKVVYDEYNERKKIDSMTINYKTKKRSCLNSFLN